MTDEKWQQISVLIESKFKVEDHGTKDLNPGTCEYYVFEGPIGRMKLERTVKPKLVDRKMHISKRIGGASKEEKIYSEDEEVSFIKAYGFEEDTQTWVEINIEELLT